MKLSKKSAEEFFLHLIELIDMNLSIFDGDARPVALIRLCEALGLDPWAAHARPASPTVNARQRRTKRAKGPTPKRRGKRRL